MLHVTESCFILPGCHSPFESKQQTRVHTPIALRQLATLGGAMFSVVSLMEKISVRLKALEQGVRDRDAHIQHPCSMFQQSALQAQPVTTSVPQRDLHREMLARVKEFDRDDDKWPGWWFKCRVEHRGQGIVEFAVPRGRSV